MTDVVLFHHACGLTPGVVAFADRLRDAGHTVTTPDLYDGARFDELDAGVAHADALGMEAVVSRAAGAVGDLDGVVVGGFSLGVAPAQHLAQNVAGVRGALLYHDGLDPVWFGSPWPAAVPVQVHLAEADSWADLDAARALVDGAADGELHLYPGDAHLFTDAGRPEHDADATDLVVARSLDALARWT